MGRRRPGYSLGIEPGVSYSWKGNSRLAQRSVRDASCPHQNFADKLESQRTGHFENGDAAFADYVVIFGFSRRF